MTNLNLYHLLGDENTAVHEYEWNELNTLSKIHLENLGKSGMMTDLKLKEFVDFNEYKTNFNTILYLIGNGTWDMDYKRIF